MARTADLPPFAAPEVTAMVGDGVAALVHRALAARGLAATPADIDAFTADYTAHAAVETRPYPGAAEPLDRLGRRAGASACARTSRKPRPGTCWTRSAWPAGSPPWRAATAIPCASPIPVMS